MVRLLHFPHKKIRAEVIREWMLQAGYTKAVCFSCGNAAQALEEAGVNVLHIGAQGIMNPNKWFTQAEIAAAFEGCFDATSGNLPMELMLEIGEAYKGYLQDDGIGDTVYVPTGSGETLVCLKLAYPQKHFIAVYNLNAATEYSEQAPLNALVRLLADEIIIMDGTEEDG